MIETTVKCPACQSQDVSIESYQSEIEHKGLVVQVSDLSRSVCGACGYEFSSHGQHDQNVALVRAAYVAERVAHKKSKMLLSGLEIKQIRKHFGLLQQEAAQLFGGGLNAFSKYENEEIVQTVSMDRLIRLVAALGSSGLELLRQVSTGQPTTLPYIGYAEPAIGAPSYYLQAASQAKFVAESIDEIDALPQGMGTLIPIFVQLKAEYSDSPQAGETATLLVPLKSYPIRVRTESFQVSSEGNVLH
jgi:HTH-type transcriptional regulator/antitoxin MqsA